jgi:MFS family permease
MSTFDATVEPSLRDLLAQRRFVRYWVSRLTGNLANQMLLVAIAWQMYEITGSAWDLGLVGLYQFVPALLLTLVAGQVADRFNRGHIILACFVAQAVTSAVLWLAAVGGFIGNCCWCCPSCWGRRAPFKCLRSKPCCRCW